MTSTKPRVLIVDDEPDVVANWARLLAREDYPCVTATDGERALALLESERPEIVLTDLKMPRVGELRERSLLPCQRDHHHPAAAPGPGRRRGV